VVANGVSAYTVHLRCNCVPVLVARSSGPAETGRCAGWARVSGRRRRLGTMATVRRFKRDGDQLELAPEVGLNEPLLRPEEAAELLSVKVSWIYEACRVGRLSAHARREASALHALGP
jgi:hypothetical protein